jgi:hypothetical protein
MSSNQIFDLIKAIIVLIIGAIIIKALLGAG